MEFYIGQIILFGGNFAIRSFALAQGQLLAISSNSALFSIYGTTYGGDGRTTFGLPDLRGRAAIGSGHGPGLSQYPLGQKSGRETVGLTINNLPQHNHMVVNTVNGGLLANSASGEEDSPNGNVIAGISAGFAEDPSAGTALGGAQGLQVTSQVGMTGNQQPFNVLNPFQVINYEVCLFGIFPSRN